jgi:HNH endonuclease
MARLLACRSAFIACRMACRSGLSSQTVSTPKGYGTAYNSGHRPVGAHRMAWELTVGPIPAGLQTVHLCDNIRCVNQRILLSVPTHPTKRIGG